MNWLLKKLGLVPQWRLDLAIELLDAYEQFVASCEACTYCGKHRYTKDDCKKWPQMNTKKYYELLCNELKRKKEPASGDYLAG